MTDLSGASVLLAEDDGSMRTVLSMELKRLGLEVTAAPGGREAVAQLEKRAFDLVITDLKMPQVDGFAVLEEARTRHPEAQVIVITGHGTVDAAVRAMKAGAFDFIQKPVDPEALAIAVNKALERLRLLREVEHLRAQVRGRFDPGKIVLVSAAMRRIQDLVQKVASTDAAVLIQGESGTGKELVARAIHAASARRNHPFVAVNCGALPEGLLESELFGHVRGAFTGAVASRPGKFQVASGGTLFLDEIGELPLNLQVKLLRALQSGEVRRVGENRSVKVNARIVTATNRDLKKGMTEGTFRDDLYYRLNVFPIVIPPLRERTDDIMPLAERFLKVGRDKHGGVAVRFSQEAAQALLDYAWPGNVRELEHAVERAVILAPGQEVRADDLPPEVRARGGDGQPRPLSELEREHILKTLDACRGNQQEAAKKLGIARNTLWRKLKEYGISAKK
ncbi:MAG: sigma-54-dependent Fis family transcriptional regulator [Elusimicrobia bacterium]|nr:sigma-54-dependent Fis family transcriptional regulator [Elusimicrobiota bacterium]